MARMRERFGLRAWQLQNAKGSEYITKGQFKSAKADHLLSTGLRIVKILVLAHGAEPSL